MSTVFTTSAYGEPVTFTAVLIATYPPRTSVSAPARQPGEPRTERDAWWRWVTTRNKPSPHDDLHPANRSIPSRALRLRQVAARSPFAGIDRAVAGQGGKVESGS